MRLCYLYFLIGAILCSGCEKTSPNGIGGNQSFKTYFLVKEFGTNSPVADATVELLHCDVPDYCWGCGCGNPSKFATIKTDANGQASYIIGSSSKLLQVDVSQSKYWRGGVYNFSRGDTVHIFLKPVGTIKASIKKINTYAYDDFLNITVRDAACSVCLLYTGTRIGLPNDTTVFLKGYGNSNNQVVWNINYSIPTVSQTLPDIYINKFDTASVNIEY